MANTRFAVALAIAFATFACAGAKKAASSPDTRRGAAERAGTRLDKVAADVKATGDEVGQKVGEKLGKVNEAIKETLGDDPHAPPPKIVNHEQE
jgi:hypothetical protein